jgi:hypothetical protein
MVVAKNPGAGQGRGGGRPRREGDRVRVAGLDLSPRAAGLLRAAVEAERVPAWAVVERALLSVLDGAAPDSGRQLPPEALEIAQECAVFLDAQRDRPAAVKALHRAWNQALALARHDLAPAADHEKLP